MGIIRCETGTEVKGKEGGHRKKRKRKRKKEERITKENRNKR